MIKTSEITKRSTQGISLSQLIKEIDMKRKGNLSSALRLYALAYALAKKSASPIL